MTSNHIANFSLWKRTYQLRLEILCQKSTDLPRLDHVDDVHVSYGRQVRAGNILGWRWE